MAGGGPIEGMLLLIGWRKKGVGLCVGLVPKWAGLHVWAGLQRGGSW